MVTAWGSTFPVWGSTPGPEMVVFGVDVALVVMWWLPVGLRDGCVGA